MRNLTSQATVETDSSSPLGLSISASKSDKELAITFVNPHHDSDLQIECALRGATGDVGAAQILHDQDWNACNSFDNPKQHAVRVEGSRIQVDVPRLSVVTAIIPIR